MFFQDNIISYVLKVVILESDDFIVLRISVQVFIHDNVNHNVVNVVILGTPSLIRD